MINSHPPGRVLGDPRTLATFAAAPVVPPLLKLGAVSLAGLKVGEHLPLGLTHGVRPFEGTIGHLGDHWGVRRRGRLPAVAVLAGSHQVGRVVASAERYGHDVIRSQLHVGRLRAAVAAGEVVAPEHLVPEALGDGHAPPPSRLSFPLFRRT